MDFQAIIFLVSGASSFKEYETGSVHLVTNVIPKMPDQADCTYLCAVIDRTALWVYVEIKQIALAASANDFFDYGN